jgi:hypothetical protein
MGFLVKTLVEVDHPRVWLVSNPRDIQTLELPKSLDNSSLAPDFSKGTIRLWFTKAPF